MVEYERVAQTKDRIKQAMQAADKTQSDLARETGLNRGTISRYLSGEVEPRMEAAYKLAAALGVSEMWLGGYDVPMQRTPSAIKNDLLAELVVKMRHEPDFLDTVARLSNLSLSSYESVKSVILALGDK